MTDKHFRYLDHEGEQLYVVHHAARGPSRATVVLAGPMSLERTHATLTWVRWARALAESGYDVWRFDYRGVGESTGAFEEQTFDGWFEDLSRVIKEARLHGADRLVVLGLRLGALLGRAAFEEHLADAFIAWDAPAGGKPMLMDMLRRKLAADYMEFSGEKKTRDDYVRLLEAGEVIEVEGYPWSRGLWRSAERFTFAPPERLEGEWLSVFLDNRTADRLPNQNYYASVRIGRPSFWLQSHALKADVDALFALTTERLDAWSDAWAASPARRGA